MLLKHANTSVTPEFWRSHYQLCTRSYMQVVALMLGSSVIAMTQSNVNSIDFPIDIATMTQASDQK